MNLGTCKYQMKINYTENTSNFFIDFRVFFSIYRFGSPHDGPESENIPSGPCNWHDGYLMSTDRKDENGLHFSRCSITAMQIFMG